VLHLGVLLNHLSTFFRATEQANLPTIALSAELNVGAVVIR
jgi:hypothetical protein